MKKKLKTSKYLIEYSFLVVFFSIINLLPIKFTSKLGSLIFRSLGIFSKKHSLAIQNCKLVFPDLDDKKIKNIVIKSWENLGKTIFELFKLNNIIKKYKIDIVGEKNIKKIIENKKQAIFIGIHQSNWEICVPLLDNLDIKVGAIYRHINNNLIDKLVLNKRMSSIKNSESFYTPKGRKSAKDIIDGIKKNNSVFLLVDQKDSAGEKILFFNIPVNTQTGFIKIARKYKIPIIPMQNQRIADDKFSVTFFEPIEDFNKKISDKDIMLSIHKIIEDWIRSNPSQWFWQHNRFN
mgnify:CR=1 FL=1